MKKGSKYQRRRLISKSNLIVASCYALLLAKVSAVTNHVSDSGVSFASNADLTGVNIPNVEDNDTFTSVSFDGAIGNYWEGSWPAPVLINTVVLTVGQNGATSSYNEMFKVDIWAGEDSDFTLNTLCQAAVLPEGSFSCPGVNASYLHLVMAENTLNKPFELQDIFVYSEVDLSGNISDVTNYDEGVSWSTDKMNQFGATPYTENGLYTVIEGTTKCGQIVTLDASYSITAVLMLSMTSYWVTIELATIPATTTTLCNPSAVAINTSLFNTFDCSGAQTNQLNFLDSFGATQIIHRKIVILSDGIPTAVDNCAEGVQLDEFTVPELTTQVSSEPLLYTFSTTTAACGEATFSLRDPPAWASFTTDSVAKTATIELSPTSIADVGEYSMILDTTLYDYVTAPSIEIYFKVKIIGDSTSDIDATQSYFSSTPTDGMAEVTSTVITVQAVDSAGNQITTGGEFINLYVENLDGADDDSVPGLPKTTLMTDNGDGTYSSDHIISGSGGTVAVSARVQGLKAEYYSNLYWTDPPDFTQIDPNVDFHWLEGDIGPLSLSDQASARWTGYIVAPTTDTYDFRIRHDDGFSVTIGTASTNSNLDGSTSLAGLSLNTDSLTQFDLTWQEKYYGARIQMYWSTATMAEEIVPATACQYLSQPLVENTVHQIEIYPTSVPSQCTIESAPTTHLATDTYILTIQSRNINGDAHDDLGRDKYWVEFTRNDGGGSEAYITTATDQGSGLYEARLNPTVPGTYIVSVYLDNPYTGTDLNISTQISGSPFTVIVTPGAVDSPECLTDIPQLTISMQEAGVPFDFTISCVDLQGNLAKYSPDLVSSVDIEAVYNNHADWASPIGAPDYPNWQTIFGTKIIGTSTDNKDGTIGGSVTILRAGDYVLTVRVSGQDVSYSPFAFLKVQPGGMHVPNSFAVEVPSTMYTGTSYSFLIQGRDEYQNNLVSYPTPLETLKPVTFSHSIDSYVEASGKISEDPEPGVYTVEVTFQDIAPEGSYFMRLSGIEISSTQFEFLKSIDSESLEEQGWRQIDKTPAFESKTALQKDTQLSYTEDSEGSQVLSKVTLNDAEDWQQVLPAIKGEDTGERFAISVDLGQTANFLSYDPIKRLFSFDSHGVSVDFQRIYIAKIGIKGPNGRISNYQLPIYFEKAAKVCDRRAQELLKARAVQDETKTPTFDAMPGPARDQKLDDYIVYFQKMHDEADLEARSDADETLESTLLPRASIEEITIFGEVKIKFSSQMDFPDDISNLFSYDNSTLIGADGCPLSLLSMQMMDYESEAISDILVSWDVTTVTPDEVNLQLQFSQPFNVSQGYEFDKLLIFLDLGRFKDVNGFEAAHFIFLMADLPKLIDLREDIEAIEAGASVYRALISSIVSSSTVINIILKQSFKGLWGLINSQQIYLYFLLFEKLNMPQNALAATQSMVRVLNFDMIDTEDLLDQYVFEKLPEGAFSANMEAFGYESFWLLANISLLHWTFVAHGVCLILGVLLSFMFCRRVDNRLKSLFQRYFIWNGLIRLLMESFQDILMIALLNVTFVPWVDNWSRLNATEKYSIILSLATLITISFLLLFFSVLYCRKFETITEYSNISAMLTGVRYKDEKKSRWLLFHPFFFFARRITFVMIVLFARGHLNVQIFTMLAVGSIQLCYIARVQPLETPLDNKLEIMNEVTILSLSHCLIVFKYYDLERSQQYTIGWVFITITCCNITINGTFLVRATLINVKNRLRSQALKKAQRKRDQAIDDWQRTFADYTGYEEEEKKDERPEEQEEGQARQAENLRVEQERKETLMKSSLIEHRNIPFNGRNVKPVGEEVTMFDQSIPKTGEQQPQNIVLKNRRKPKLKIPDDDDDHHENTKVEVEQTYIDENGSNAGFQDSYSDHLNPQQKDSDSEISSRINSSSERVEQAEAFSYTNSFKSDRQQPNDDGNRIEAASDEQCQKINNVKLEIDFQKADESPRIELKNPFKQETVLITPPPQMPQTEQGSKVANSGHLQSMLSGIEVPTKSNLSRSQVESKTVPQTQVASRQTQMPKKTRDYPNPTQSSQKKQPRGSGAAQENQMDLMATPLKEDHIIPNVYAYTYSDRAKPVESASLSPQAQNSRSIIPFMTKQRHLKSGSRFGFSYLQANSNIAGSISRARPRLPRSRSSQLTAGPTQQEQTTPYHSPLQNVHVSILQKKQLHQLLQEPKQLRSRSQTNQNFQFIL